MKKLIILLPTLLFAQASFAENCGEEKCFEAKSSDIFKYEWKPTIDKKEQNITFTTTITKQVNWLKYICKESFWDGDKSFINSDKKDIPDSEHRLLTKSASKDFPYQITSSYRISSINGVPRVEVNQTLTSKSFLPTKINVTDGGTTDSKFSVQTYDDAKPAMIMNVDIFGSKRLPGKTLMASSAYSLSEGGLVNTPLMFPRSESYNLGTLKAFDSMTYYIDAPKEGFRTYQCTQQMALKAYKAANQTFQIGRSVPKINYDKKIGYISGPGKLKYFFNFTQTKVFVKNGNKLLVSFSRANQVADTGFSSNIKDEAFLLDNFLNLVKSEMRPTLFAQTYGDISIAIKKMKNHIENGGTALHDSVKQEFEAAYFLANKIVDKDIAKDKEVQTYGPIVINFLAHLDYLNKEFFQFNPEEPGVKIIKLTAQSIQQSAERALLVIAGETDNKEVKKAAEVLEYFVDKTEDLIVMDPLGSLNEEALNILYDLLDYYDDNFKSVERALIDFNVDSNLSQMKSVFDLLEIVTE